MYIGIKHLHSGIAYLLLAGLLFSIIYISIAYFSKKPFTEGLKKIALLGLVSAHLQLVTGLLIYFISPLGIANASSEAMKSSMARLYFLEHPLTMLIAIALITVGYSRGKRLNEDSKRYGQILLFYALGLLLILIRIPWQAWLN